MPVKLTYVISFVDDVEGATAFYRDTLEEAGLPTEK